MQVEHYIFEVKPFIYAGQHGGQEKVLHLSAKVNGQEYHVENVMAGKIQPFETELQYYAKIATLTLEENLKEIK